MSAGIGKYDLVIGKRDTMLDPKSGELKRDWHGLTQDAPELNEKTITRTLFPIIQADSYSIIDGVQVLSPKSKNLVADLRKCRPDLEKGVLRLVHLHTPRKSYNVIDNRAVWEAAKKCIADVEDCVIERVFTLEDLTKFGVSIAIGEREITLKRANNRKEKILCQLNLITSHDGKLAMQAYDSTTRIVCMNTLRWSLDAAGKVGFRVYHTKNAGDALQNFPALIQSILSGRADFINQMGYFDSIPVSHDDALFFLMAFLDGKSINKEKEQRQLGRMVNTAEGIQSLFIQGKGNFGNTMYDLLCGATEWWTGGKGTGENADAAKKAYKADFGAAADHKNAFVNFLMKLKPNTDAIVEAKERGKKLYLEAA